MKKTLFLLTCIIGLLFLVSCSKDESYSSSENNIKSTKIRWYGVNNPTDEPAIRGVADKSKLWNKEAGITIKFINTPTDTIMIDKIKSIAAEWRQYAGIRFNFVDSNENASVRIAFNWEGNDWLTWSYTGTDAKYIRKQSEPTAVFGGLEYADEEQFRGDVLRVFGQILGLEYEQRHQSWSFWKNESKLEMYWTDMFEGLNMDWNEIKEYVFTPLNGENAIHPTQTQEIDELSVMAWPYYTRIQTTKLLANNKLSQGDKSFIAQLYPKDKNALPKIQDDWVDAGYFKWTDSTKTALKITAFGAKQEILPSVSDGYQLTSADNMFENATLLKEIPKFESYNINSFKYTFSNCYTLDKVLNLDTWSGRNFSGMFNNCRSLTILLLNTANGNIFFSMFAGCRSLPTIEPIDTSKGFSFTCMFADCTSLTSIPPLNTSNGAYFVEMFVNCISLQEKPNLDFYSASMTDNMYKGTPFENSL